MIKLDKKFTGGITKVKDGTVVPGDQWVVFLAKDTAFANILPLYLQECHRLGCDEAHMALTETLITNVTAWRQANPTLCKIPDAEGERLLP